MLLCRVLGPVVSTVKHPTYRGLTLLLVEPLDAHGRPDDDGAFVAVDRVQSGAGDVVLVMQEGNGVRQLFGIEALPIRSIIVGHVDAVEVEPEARIDADEAPASLPEPVR